MRLLLIRHGQTQANVNHQLDTAYPGYPLNELGMTQAEALVDAIDHEPIDALYASTLTRAQQTAAPLAKARGLDPTILDGVQEISAGHEEMSPDWTNYIDVLSSWSPTNLDVGLDGGETAREFLTRYTKAIGHIEAAGHERAAVVSHGAAIRVWSITQDPSIGMRNATELKNTEWIVLNGGVAAGWRIEQWATARFH